MKKGSYHGSSKETHKIHAGEVAGAGMITAREPGKAAMKIKPNGCGMGWQGGANSTKTPGMKTYSEE